MRDAPTGAPCESQRLSWQVRPFRVRSGFARPGFLQRPTRAAGATWSPLALVFLPWRLASSPSPSWPSLVPHRCVGHCRQLRNVSPWKGALLSLRSPLSPSTRRASPRLARLSGDPLRWGCVTLKQQTTSTLELSAFNYDVTRIAASRDNLPSRRRPKASPLEPSLFEESLLEGSLLEASLSGASLLEPSLFEASLLEGKPARGEARSRGAHADGTRGASLTAADAARGRRSHAVSRASGDASPDRNRRRSVQQCLEKRGRAALAGVDSLSSPRAHGDLRATLSSTGAIPRTRGRGTGVAPGRG